MEIAKQSVFTTIDELNILILEDSASDFELIKLSLFEINFSKIAHAKNFNEFKSHYETGVFNTILSDYNIPGESAVDILKAVRASDKLTPYIFVSGTVGEEQAVELLKLGATDYVLKDNLQKLPFTLNRAIKEANMNVAETMAIEALKENEKKFRNIIENAPDATLLVAEDSEIHFANKQASKIFGYERNEFSKIKIDNLIPGRYRENHNKGKDTYTQNPLPRVMGEGMQLFGLRKDGSEFPVDISISPISKDESGKTLTVCSVRDITNRKKAEEEILKKKKLLNDAQKLAKVGSWEWELKTNNVDWSDELYNIVGLVNDGSQLKFELLFDYMHPEDRDEMILASKNKVKTQIKFSPQFRIITPAGKVKHLKSIEHQTLNEHGEIEMISGTIQDITDLVLAEKQKREIQEQILATLEQEVKARTAELFNTNRFLEYRNNEITDSINYAHNIQLAVLNDETDCTKVFPESFVLWMPKDVVSGDFFWVHTNEQYEYIAVADCTGHGVPGAFMSIISNQTLQRILVNEKISQPKDILYHLNESLVNSLNQKTGIVNDGMDIAIIRIDRKNNTMIFAGAQRHLLLFNGENLEVFEGCKEGIGGYLIEDKPKDFWEKEIEYKKGDIVYLTSDGYCSQFGGENGKKMMKKRMHSFIQSIAKLPLSEQKKELYDFYTEWQGKEEQVDDVLVVGIAL